VTRGEAGHEDSCRYDDRRTPVALLSCATHYGPLFHGPAGVHVPVGVPLVFAAAWSVWLREDGEDESPSSDIF